MRKLLIAILLSAALSAAFLCAQSNPKIEPGKRMVQAVQYPFDQKVKFDLFKTGRLTGIDGSAEVNRKKTITVEVSIDGPAPSQLNSAYKGYVAWALTPSGRWENLGSVDRKGTVKTTTKLTAFGIVVSAESNLQAASPTDPVLESGMPEGKRHYYPIQRVYYEPAVKQ